MLELDALVEKASELEPLPATVSRLASIVASDDSSAQDVAEVVAFDPHITAVLLRFVNSAAGGARAQIETVPAAVTRLGMGAVLEVAMANSVSRKLKAPMPEFELDAGTLWRHSVASALAAESLQRCCRTRVAPETFTAALLHDIGKLVLCRFLDRELLGYLKRAREDGGQSALLAEREILGVDHAELGGLVCQHWELSEGICKSVMYHHDPDQAFHAGADAVHVSNAVAHFVEQTKAGAEKDGPLPEVQAGPLDRLGLDAAGLRKLIGIVRNGLEDVLARYES